MTPNPVVFISYSHNDLSFVRRLQSNLLKLNVLTWQDVQRLEAGVEWSEEIERALRRCDVLVLVISHASSRSQYVGYEWAFAMGAGAKIVPVLLEKVRVHPRLERLQFIDYTARRGKPWLRLVDRIDDLVRGRTPRIEISLSLNEYGKPEKIRREYVCDMWVANIPRGTRRVRYEIHHPSFRQPCWSEKNAPDSFATWFSSYGDVLISARFENAAGRPTGNSAQTTLFAALRRRHGHTASPIIRRAVEDIGRS